MERYEDKIEKALQYLKQPSKTDARGSAPIVYLVCVFCLLVVLSYDQAWS